MGTRLEHHPNETWIAALKAGGEANATLLSELSHYIRRVLASTLSRRKLSVEELTELSQEAMLQLLKSFPTFRGDSSFPTWAAAVATRVASNELNRRAAREAKHEAFRQARVDALAKGEPDRHSQPEATDQHLVEVLYEAIEEELTDRQRIATLAILRGVPTVEIAEQLDSNKNAVYKLVHDARLRLRAALQRRGVTALRVAEAIGEAGEQ